MPTLTRLLPLLTREGVDDAAGAVEPDPNHRVGYGHRPMALTQLRTPDWRNALADPNWRIELFPGCDAAGYRFRALVHDNLGNHAEAERDRPPARGATAIRAAKRVSRFSRLVTLNLMTLNHGADATPIGTMK